MTPRGRAAGARFEESILTRSSPSRVPAHEHRSSGVCPASRRMAGRPRSGLRSGGPGRGAAVERDAAGGRARRLERRDHGVRAQPRRRKHPLIQALAAPPRSSSTASARIASPLEGRAFHAIPLRAETPASRARDCCSSSGLGPRARCRDALAGAHARQAGVAPARAVSCSPRRASARSGCCSTASSTRSPIRSC